MRASGLRERRRGSFLADDSLNLAEERTPSGQKVVQSAGELADQSGTQQQFVRDDLRFGGSFLRVGN
jgi:hypothetical protein